MYSFKLDLICVWSDRFCDFSARMMASSLAQSVLMGDSKRYVEYYEYTDENLALYENLLTLEHVEHYICRDLTLEVQNYI